MEICLAILFTALFPLVAHTSWGLSDCVVDGNFRIKCNGLRLSEVYPGCGYEEACKIAARASRNHILLDSNPAGKNVSFSNPGKLNHDTHSEWTHTLQPGEFMYQFHELLGPRESLRQAKWTEFGGEVDPQIKIKAVAIRNGNGCQIVKQQMPNAKEGDDFILSFYSP